MTPEEAWSKSKLIITHLRPFGCKAYAHVPIQRRSKLDSKMIECIFLGYCTDTKGYRLYNQAKKEVIISRDVIFDKSEDTSHHDNSQSPNEVTIETFHDTPEKEQITPSSDTRDQLDSDIESIADSEPAGSITPTGSTVPTGSIIPAESAEHAEPRRSMRESKAPECYGQNYACIAIAEPQSYKEALSLPDANEWEKAMQEEHDLIIANRTWSIVDLPQGQRTISCKWVYKIKYTPSGEIKKYKA